MKNVMKTVKGKRKWENYYKRSLVDVPPFIGWDKLLSLIDACNEIDYDIYHRHLRERDKGLIACLFETGGRIGEVVTLAKANFDFSHKRYCIVSDMLLEKRYEKTGSYIEILKEEPTGAFAKLYTPYLHPETGKQQLKRKRWRTTITSDKVLRLRIRQPFPIMKSDPLYPIMEQYVKHSHSELLFPSSKLRKNKTRFMTTTNAWIILNRIQKITGIQIWNHWFRSQRASQLKNEYGFDSDDRMDWFNWLSDPTAALYPKTSALEMATKMLKVKANITKLRINRP